jgi:hypothetical protein
MHKALGSIPSSGKKFLGDCVSKKKIPTRLNLLCGVSLKYLASCDKSCPIVSSYSFSLGNSHFSKDLPTCKENGTILNLKFT